MHNDFDKNAVVFDKLLVLNGPMGNKNVLVVFIACVIAPHKNHFGYVSLLKDGKRGKAIVWVSYKRNFNKSNRLFCAMS